MVVFLRGRDNRYRRHLDDHLFFYLHDFGDDGPLLAAPAYRRKSKRDGKKYHRRSEAGDGDRIAPEQDILAALFGLLGKSDEVVVNLRGGSRLLNLGRGLGRAFGGGCRRKFDFFRHSFSFPRQIATSYFIFRQDTV